MTLESLQNPLVKKLAALREKKKERETTKKVLVLGEKICREIAEISPPLAVYYLGEHNPFPSVPGKAVSEKVMKKISGLQSPCKVACEFPLPSFSSSLKKENLLILDGVQDPGNLGTLLRSALAFNFSSIFFTGKCADPFGEKALTAGRGAPFYLNLYQGSLEKVCQQANDLSLPLFCAHMEGKAPKTIERPFALILGTEGQGQTPFALNIGEKVSLNMNPRCESLNVAVAGSLLMYLMGGNYEG